MWGTLAGSLAMLNDFGFQIQLGSISRGTQVTMFELNRIL